MPPVSAPGSAGPGCPSHSRCRRAARRWRRRVSGRGGAGGGHGRRLAGDDHPCDDRRYDRRDDRCHDHGCGRDQCGGDGRVAPPAVAMGAHDPSRAAAAAGQQWRGSPGARCRARWAWPGSAARVGSFRWMRILDRSLRKAGGGPPVSLGCGPVSGGPGRAVGLGVPGASVPCACAACPGAAVQRWPRLDPGTTGSQYVERREKRDADDQRRPECGPAFEDGVCLAKGVSGGSVSRPQRP